MPANGIRGEKMTEELGNNAQAVRLVSVNGVVVFGESFLEEFLPHTVEFAETLADETKELVISTFLGATLDDHGRHLVFQTRRKVDAQKLVGTFFETSRRHDGQVDGTAQIDEVGVGCVLDLYILFLDLFFIVTARHVGVAIFIFLVTTFSLAQNLGLELFICFFVYFPFGVKLENV